MLRTVLLMLASGMVGGIIGVAAVLYLFIGWSSDGSMRGWSITTGGKPPERVTSAPRIDADEDFLGTTGSHSDRFTATSDKVLEAGPGRIVGKVTASGAALPGLKLRLLLNGEVKSEWVVSGADGSYQVPVPHGRYRVDGYELDSRIARELLKGKTDAPRRGFQTETAVVAAGLPGAGLDLHYVDPVRITAPEGTVPSGAPVVVGWAPYPAADSYRLQLIEFAHRDDWNTQRYVFDWKNRPVVRGTSLDLKTTAADLRKGHHYSVQIEALDANGRPIASNGMRMGRVNFNLSP